MLHSKVALPFEQPIKIILNCNQDNIKTVARFQQIKLNKPCVFNDISRNNNKQ